jgi:Rieske Fe-S protein
VPRAAAACKPVASLDGGPVPAVGAARLLEGDVRVIVARDASGVYAFTGVCSHMGGALLLEADGTSHCPAHDSRFGKNGEVLKGPAVVPLRHFRSSSESGTEDLGRHDGSRARRSLESRPHELATAGGVTGGR